MPIKSRSLLSLVALALLALAPLSAHALVSPLGVSLLKPVQFPWQDFDIYGARLNLLWGQHRIVYGIDLGLGANVTDVAFGGIQIAGITNVNNGSATVTGLQLAGVTNVNVNKASIVGVQAALGVNSNQAESTIVGFELAALANLCPATDIWGVQLALYNRARIVHGLQIGLVNVTDNLHGVQIGLVNFNHQGPFAVAPILNVGF